MKGMDAKAKRIGSLDSLRGIAALIVVLYHYTSRFPGLFPDAGKVPFEFRYGHYGVELFFLISGFVIFMTLEKAKSVSDFALRRFARLYPPFWFCAILTFILVSAMGPASRSISASGMLTNLSMISGMFGKPRVDGVYWSLEQELIFYILMAAVLSLKQTKNIEWFCVFWMVAAIVATKLGFSEFRKNFLALDYAPLFSSGIAFFLMYNNRATWKTWLVLLMGIGTAGFTLVPKISSETHDSSLVVWLCLAACFGVFALFVFWKNALLERRALAFLGAISYPLYLVHQNIGYGIMLKFGAIGLAPVLTFFLTLAIALGLATGVHYLIEVPSLNFIAAKLKKPQVPAVAKVPDTQ